MAHWKTGMGLQLALLLSLLRSHAWRGLCRYTSVQATFLSMLDAVTDSQDRLEDARDQVAADAVRQEEVRQDNLMLQEQVSQLSHEVGSKMHVSCVRPILNVPASLAAGPCQGCAAKEPE